MAGGLARGFGACAGLQAGRTLADNLDELASVREGSPATSTTPRTEGTGPTTVRGRHHVLEVPEVVCRVDDRCSLRLRLVAEDGWTVNAEYPTKFTAEPPLLVDFERKNRKFSRSDVMMESTTAASLFVRFRASEPGETLLRGAFKAAVCKGDECMTFDDAVAARVTLEARVP